jgi:hypothetical protein
LVCQYTAMKTQKNKRWQDGYLEVCAGGRKLKLYSEQGACLDESFQALHPTEEDYDFEKFTVHVDDPSAGSALAEAVVAPSAEPAPKRRRPVGLKLRRTVSDASNRASPDLGCAPKPAPYRAAPGANSTQPIVRRITAPTSAPTAPAVAPVPASALQCCEPPPEGRSRKSLAHIPKYSHRRGHSHWSSFTLELIHTALWILRGTRRVACAWLQRCKLPSSLCLGFQDYICPLNSFSSCCQQSGRAPHSKLQQFNCTRTSRIQETGQPCKTAIVPSRLRKCNP